MKIVCLGEILLRYATKEGTLFSDLSFDTCIGGCETNVSVSLAQYGWDVSLASKIPDHGLGDGVIRFLKGYGIDTSSIIRDEGRLGVYYLQSGIGNRHAAVIYDRAYSAMTSLSASAFQLDELFKDVDVFMTSGITAALSKELHLMIKDMMRYCREHGIKVIYDVNYRGRLWSVEEAGASLRELLPYIDILSAGLLDAQNFLHITSDAKSHVEKLADVYHQMKVHYPNLQLIMSTKRDLISTSVNDLQGFLFDGVNLYASDIIRIDDIVDRVGGGDAFLAGVLHGVTTYETFAEALNFGVSAAVLKHTVYGDVNKFSAEEVDAFMKQGVQKIDR